MPPGQTRARLCAVLIGGAGSRLGGEKHLVPLAGRPLAAWALAAAREARLEPILIAKPATPLGPLAAPGPDGAAPPEVVREPTEPLHPLAGIAAALAHAGEPIVTCPCDMPRLTPGLLDRLAAGPGPLVVSGPGGPEPLLGRWEPGQQAAVAEAVAAGHSARATVAALAIATLGGDELERLAGREGDEGAGVAAMLANVNTPAELALSEEALRR